MLWNLYLEECDLCLKKKNVLLINKLGFCDGKQSYTRCTSLKLIYAEWFIAYKSTFFCSISLVNVFLMQDLQALPKCLENKAVLQ